MSVNDEVTSELWNVCGIMNADIDEIADIVVFLCSEASYLFVKNDKLKKMQLSC
jgi:hypothetical protein